MTTESKDSEFCKIFLDIGQGKYPEINNNHAIEIPAALCQVVEDTDTLIQYIYERYTRTMSGAIAILNNLRSLLSGASVSERSSYALLFRCDCTPLKLLGRRH